MDELGENGLDELEEDVVCELEDGVDALVVLFPSVCVFGREDLEQLAPFPTVCVSLSTRTGCAGLVPFLSLCVPLQRGSEELAPFHAVAACFLVPVACAPLSTVSEELAPFPSMNNMRSLGGNGHTWIPHAKQVAPTTSE